MAAEQPSSGEERTPLGALLVAEGLLNDVQLHQALHLGSQTGERLGEIVVRQGLASEEDVARLLADQWDLGYVDRASIWFDANALARLSREDAQRLEAMPTRVEDGRVVVAVAEPTEERLAALREVIGEDTVVVVVPKAALEAGLHSELLKSNGQPAEKAEPAGRGRRRRRPLPSAHRPSSWSAVGGRDEPGNGDARAARTTTWPLRSQPSCPPTSRPSPRRTPAAARAADAAPARRAAAAPAAQVGGGLAESIAQLIEAQIGAARQRRRPSGEEAGGARAADQAAGEGARGEPCGARRARQAPEDDRRRPRQALTRRGLRRSSFGDSTRRSAVRPFARQPPSASRCRRQTQTSAAISARFPVSMNASAGLKATPPMPCMTMIGLGTLRPSALAESRLPSTPPAKTPAAIATPAGRETRQRQHGDEDEARADEPDDPTGDGRPRAASRRCASRSGRSRPGRPR